VTPRRRGLLVALGVWAAVRIAYWATGGGFATDALRTSWQLLEPSQLRADPLGSVWLLHIQPPLYNLFVGGVLAWSPLPTGLTFQLLYLACGAVLIVALHATLRECGWSEFAATVGAVAVAVNPVVLSYEQTPSYELPAATGIVVAAWCCARYARTRSTRALVAFAAALTFVTLTRALLHPAWLAVVAVTVVLVARPERGWRALAAAAAIPLVLIGGWMAKNAVLFDEPTLSSWLGMNLARGVIAPMPRDTVDEMVRAGDVTPVARVRPFSGYDKYAPMVGPCRTGWTDPEVRRLYKRNGVSNFNSVCFLPVYRDEQSNALTLIRERPGDYLGTRYAPAALHVVTQRAPGTESFADNAVLDGLLDAWSPLLVHTRVTIHDGGWSNPLIPGAPEPTPDVSITMALATLLVIGIGGRSAWRLVRPGGTDDLPQDLTRALLGFTVLFVTAVSVATEYGENGRFRFLVDPILIGVTAAVITDLGLRIVRGRRSRSPGSGRHARRTRPPGTSPTSHRR
jgi:hypothetical protein